MQKVLVITYYWPPSGGAGVQRWVKLCKYLPQFGVRPTVLTVDPEKASYPSLDHSLGKEVDPSLEVHHTDSFEPLKVYGRIVGSGNVPTAGFSNVDKQKWSTRLAARLRSTLFIPDPRKGWNKFAIRKALDIIGEQNIQKVITTGPPHSTHLIGLELRKKSGVEWTADMRDPWTDIYYYKDLNHTRRSAEKDKALEMEVLKGADRVICANEHLKDLLIRKSNSHWANKFHVVTNGFDPADLQQHQSEKDEEHFWITYTGTMSEHYDPAIFLESVSALKKFSDRLKIRFVGTVSSRIIDSAEALGLQDRVEVVTTVPHKESIGYLLASDALLLVIPKVDHDESIVPGKLFEYIGARKPIICIGPEDGAAARIIEESGAGSTFDRTDSSKLEGHLNALINGEIKTSTEHDTNVYSRPYQAGLIAALLKDDPRA